MFTHQETKSKTAFENANQETDSLTRDQEYKKFLEKHNFNEMNFSFASFLRRVEMLTIAEAGAL